MLWKWQLKAQISCFKKQKNGRSWKCWNNINGGSPGRELLLIKSQTDWYDSEKRVWVRSSICITRVILYDCLYYEEADHLFKALLLLCYQRAHNPLGVCDWME